MLQLVNKTVPEIQVSKQVRNRRLVGSTDQAYSSGF